MGASRASKNILLKAYKAMKSIPKRVVNRMGDQFSTAERAIQDTKSDLADRDRRQVMRSREHRQNMKKTGY